MPHLFTNRPRKHSLNAKHAAHKQFQWEAVNATVYLVGGVLFIIGSVFFLPKYEAYSDTGVIIFIIGSLLYLLVTGHDLLETLIERKTKARAHKDSLELTAALLYVAGTLLFIVGSVFFLSDVGLITAGSYSFIFGSILFFAGACINVMQITQSPNACILQLLNATAISFVVGSTIFTFGSVPYLFEHLDKTDELLIFTLVGWEFIIGSVFFLLGGVFNFIRAYLSLKQHSRQTG